MYSVENRDGSEILEDLASLHNQVEEVRLPDKLGKQNFHDIIKNIGEPLTDTTKNNSENLTKTTTETYIKNNMSLANLNDSLLEIKNDRRYISKLFVVSFIQNH